MPRPRRNSVLLPVLLAIICTSCDRCNPVQVRNHESFQITYIDRSRHIRVRSSDDGLAWTESAGFSPTADSGVGASASSDGTGVTRVVADGGTINKLRLTFGLGTANWSAQPIVFNDIRPARRPTIIDIGRSVFIIALQNESSRERVSIFKFEQAAQRITDITPLDNMPNLTNSGVHHGPAMIFLPPDSTLGRARGRIVLAWARHSDSEHFTPVEIQVLSGEVADNGGINWISAQKIDDGSSAGAILSEPALAQNTRNAYLIVHREPAGNSLQPRLPSAFFARRSRDGVQWEPSLPWEITSARGGFVEFATSFGCTVTAMLIPNGAENQPVFFRRTPADGFNVLHTIPLQDVFGANLPEHRQFSLIAVGKRDAGASDCF